MHDVSVENHTPWSSSLPQNLAGPQLVKNFPTFYGTRTFSYHLHKLPPPVPILNQIDLLHASGLTDDPFNP
jgi:hypothetical protein